MPSHMPSSFASAAAGQASNRDARGGGRGDTRAGGDWPRRENSRSNGTLTLRRSSTTPHGSAMTSAQQPESANPLPSVDDTTSQLQHIGGDAGMGIRYTKQNLLDVFRNQQNSEPTNDEVSRLFVSNWDPSHANGNTGRGWGKTGDNRDHSYGPDICWDPSGHFQPVGLEDMSALEKTIFTESVNAPTKPTTQSNNNKDQSTPGAPTNGRKGSFSHISGGVSSFGLASPTTSRPGPRRRETTETTGFGSIASPVGGSRFQRDDSSPFFSRRATDLKDGSQDDRGEEVTGGNKTGSPFSALLRTNTGGGPLGSAGASPWGASPTNTTMSPMGNFGSFAMGGSAATPTTPSEKRPGFGSMRGESRLAHLMPKQSSEDMASKGADNSRAQGSSTWRARQRDDADPFADDQAQSGSSVLGGAQDTGSAQRRLPDSIHSMEGQPRGHEAQGTTDQAEHESSLNRGSLDDNDEAEIENELRNIRNHGLNDIPEHVTNAFGGLPRAFTNPAFDGSDRSATSSVGPSKGFPSLGGISGLSGFGGLSGWPSSANPIGTPDRERSGFQGAFGSSLFGPSGDLQSPSLGGLGHFSGSSSNLAGTGTIGRGSKLGSLFPAAMQAQMQTNENDHAHESAEQRQPSAFGAIGRNAFGARDTDSPLRAGRGVFDDMFQSSEARNPGLANATQQDGNPGAFAHTPISAPNYQQSQGSSDSASSLPQTQQRTMVMPDRMRWVYLDPQGQVQGPWSGLEMHDWYKASFFTADLSVKKVEDNEFEPLGQLIRRIGNSREPFLVPQIGVPHGAPSAQTGAPFAASAAASAPQGGTVQPPFAGAFPSFGTTLTAEQQNNLERRKQEEQYLMARQREFLAQQQVNMKQMQMQGGIPSSLHHHSSAHSLQSQPSFSSITSPIGMPGGQLQGVSGFFDNARQPLPSSGMGMPPTEYFREDEIARLNLQERQQGFPQPNQGQQLPPIFSQQSEMHRDAQRGEQVRANESNNPRLREFEQLRAQHEMEQAAAAQVVSGAEPIGPPRQQPLPAQASEAMDTREEVESKLELEPQTLSLTEQVQKAASAKHSPTAQPDSPWAKVGTGLPMPFPPPQSTTPLPAPTAQRGRSDLAETLNLGTLSRPETPEDVVTAPSVAPWAKEPSEAPRGPSLKEIQEAEAKKAAKLEEAAVAARRAAAEQELRNLPTVIPVAPGLPTSANWAAASPVTTSAPSAWAKPSVPKIPTPASSSAASKKTLADIQREEELRKLKIAAATASAAVPGVVVGGKRYADLASKPTAPVASNPSAAGGAWSTVGSSGKAKAPAGSVAQAPVTPSVRSVSTTAVPASPAMRAARPVTATSRGITPGPLPGSTVNVNAATEEFQRWARNTLSKDLNPGMTVENVMGALQDVPMEPEIVFEIIYSSSARVGARQTAEEYIRRRALADRGIMERSGASSSSPFSNADDSKSSGGWNEVAKKGPVNVKEEPAAGFKVIPSKKKGRK